MKKISCLLFSVVFLAAAVNASRIMRLPLKELPGKANSIVLGEVIKVIPQDNENLDTVTIKIDAVLKGELEDKEATFVLSTRGGLKDFDPQLKVGNQGVFFLVKKNGTFEKAYWGSIALFPKNNFN
ncbi:MAG: hypothetical protein JXI33_01425 [Candidatus Aminicenantes bacterium]|nr:hypothetical protein [Candidatus Aminicenantes bacterium]